MNTSSGSSLQRIGPPNSRARVIAASGLFLVLSLTLGSVLAVLAARFFPDLPDGKLVKVARRCMMGAAGVFLPFFLRAIGFRGLADCGWGAVRGTRFRTFAAGMAAGMAVLLPLAVLATVLGTRPWEVAAPVAALPGILLGYLASSMFVGVTEETMARGLLFLPLRRSLGGVTAALASGALFAWAHFMEPNAMALRNPSVCLAVRDTLFSALTHVAGEPHAAARFANLVLMSCVLCAATARTGTIWLAAGLHAGWVWIKKSNAILTQSNYEHPLQSWLGARSDFLDGWGCTLALAALLVALRPAPKATRSIHPETPQ